MSYQIPTVPIVSRGFIASLVAAVAVALLIVVLSATPLLLDIVIPAVDLIARVPLALAFVILLLLLTAAAGGWATYTGIRAQEKRMRISRKRRRYRS